MRENVGMFQNLAVLGSGLLGASLMQAMKAKGLCQNAYAWSRREETRRNCAAQSWCDGVFDTPAEAAAAADLVVICVPVEHIVPTLKDIARALKPGTIVTDVGSTKQLIVHRAAKLMPEGCHFVGSHPMAGSEKTGLDHASDELFTGRACFVTPLSQTDPEATARVAQLWHELGMSVTQIAPEAHDEIVAHISHLPHLLASVLCDSLASKDTHWLDYAGGGLRDTTRIAAGAPALWKEIVSQNREEILRAMQAFDQHWKRLQEVVETNDMDALEHILANGKSYRDRLS